MKSMLVKDASKRCTWEYLFSQPLNKEGEFNGDVRPYEQDPPKSYNPLQPLDHNINYNKDQYATFQQYAIPYSPMETYKKDHPRTFQKE
jgi:hypothetical protein